MKTLILVVLGLLLWVSPAMAKPTGSNSAADTVVIEAPIATVLELAPQAFAVWPRGELVAVDTEAKRVTGLSRTNFFKFVDDLIVTLKPLSETQTEIAIASQGRMGEFDFGGNQRNIDEYLATLKALLQQAS